MSIPAAVAVTAEDRVFWCLDRRCKSNLSQPLPFARPLSGLPNSPSLIPPTDNSGLQQTMCSKH